MNIKTLVAAFAVAASTVASASIFNWTITGGYSADNLLLQGYEGTIWRGEGNIKLGDVKNVDSAFKWESGKLYIKNVDYPLDAWHQVGSLNFKLTGYTGEGATTPGDYIKSGSATWNDIYAALKKSGSYDFTIKTGTSDIATIKLTSHVIPEPTSGLLLLLGTGMLALRRKAVRA